MTAETVNQHIAITPGVCGGKPRIAGRRITVANIAIWHERLGKSADDIATEYDLTLADVHAALAYYFDHRAEIEEWIAESRALIAVLRKENVSRLAEKLREQTRHGENPVLHG
jgi:uncharacterized protein (DUF433 family)